MRILKAVIAGTITLLAMIAYSSSNASAQDSKKPNIIFVFMDNFGYGELGIYGGGITRGAATERIDALAGEGMRLLNFNVEAQCTPSRAALMTGRYAIRSGNGSVPISTGMYGLTQWEYTMAEMLSDAGYVTGMFGKWHLGQTALDPFFVAFHELAGLAFVAGKLKQYDKHPNYSPLNLVCRVLSRLAATVKRTVRRLVS